MRQFFLFLIICRHVWTHLFRLCSIQASYHRILINCELEMNMDIKLNCIDGTHSEQRKMKKKKTLWKTLSHLHQHRISPKYSWFTDRIFEWSMPFILKSLNKTKEKEQKNLNAMIWFISKWLNRSKHHKNFPMFHNKTDKNEHKSVGQKANATNMECTLHTWNIEMCFVTYWFAYSQPSICWCNLILTCYTGHIFYHK